MHFADFDCLAEVYEVDTLLQNIHAFIHAYQETGAPMFAWMIHRAANVLWQHPEYEGTDEERCKYRKLSKQWKMVAHSSSSLFGVRQ